MSESGEFQSLAIDKIVVEKRARAVNRAFVDGILVPLMRDVGLLQPIVVRRNPPDDTFVLLYGKHRLTAALALGWTTIGAVVRDAAAEHARFAEIDKHLIRNDADALERAEFLAERKAIYERLYPETKNGANGGRGGKRNETGIMPFSKEASLKARLDARTIRRSVAISLKLTAKCKGLLRGTPHADNQALLLALTKHTAGDQEFLAKCLTRSSSPAPNLKTAVAEMRRDTGPADDKTKPNGLISAWPRASAKERAEFLHWLIMTDQTIPAGFEVRDPFAVSAEVNQA